MRWILCLSKYSCYPQRLFEFLCDAYVNSLYKKSYLITPEELTQLAREIQALTQRKNLEFLLG